MSALDEKQKEDDEKAAANRNRVQRFFGPVKWTLISIALIFIIWRLIGMWQHYA
jgi:hypothetical protein